MLRQLLLAALACVACSAPAAANIYNVRSMNARPPTYGSGWRSQSVAPFPYEVTHSTGWTEFSSGPVLTRGYLIFDLKNEAYYLPKHRAVATAQLIVSRVGLESPDETEILGLFDVTTPAAAVGAVFVVDSAIFEDLGSGTLYASTEISRTDDYIEIDLNAKAIDDISRSRNGFFTVGLSLLSASNEYRGNERLFKSSVAATLRFVTGPAVPEPATLAIAATGAFALTAIRRSGCKPRRRLHL